MRPRVRLVLAGILPVRWWTGDRGIVGIGPHVHRRNFSRQMAWAAGGFLSIQCSGRDTAGLFFELRHRIARLRRDGMALETGHSRGSGGALLSDALHDSAQPALADPKGAKGRSASSAGTDWRTGCRFGIGRNGGSGRDRADVRTGTSAVIEKPIAAVSGGLDRYVQSALGY